MAIDLQSWKAIRELPANVDTFVDYPAGDYIIAGRGQWFYTFDRIQWYVGGRSVAIEPVRDMLLELRCYSGQTLTIGWDSSGTWEINILESSQVLKIATTPLSMMNSIDYYLWQIESSVDQLEGFVNGVEGLLTDIKNDVAKILLTTDQINFKNGCLKVLADISGRC